MISNQLESHHPTNVSTSVRMWEKLYYCMGQCKQFLIKKKILKKFKFIYIYNIFAAIWPNFSTHECFADEEISVQVIWTEIQ